MIVPVDVPLDGGTSTDSSGNYTFTTQIHPANWSVVRLVGQTSGGPRWTLLSDSSLPLDFGAGALASLGLVLVAPGQRLTAQILAATPSAAVLGHFVGVMSPDLNEVLPYYLPGANPIGSTVASPPILLISAPTGLNNLPTPLTVGVPIGAVSIGYVPSVNQGGSIANVTAISIVGSQSGIQYVLDTANFPTLPSPVPLDPQDTSVVCNVQAAGARPQVDFLCWTLPTALNITDRATRQVGFVRLLDANGNNVFSDGNFNLRVSEAFANPAIWQAPTTVLQTDQSAGAFPATLIAGVAGQRIRVWGWSVSLRNAAAARYVNLRGSSAAANDGFANTDLPTASQFGGNLGGGPLPTGDGLVLDSTALNLEIVRVGLAYSQG